MSRKRTKILVIKLEETEARNDRSDEDQQQFSRPTEDI
jgi:hypothetical protein